MKSTLGGALGTLAVICLVFGVWLDYSFVVHHFAGNGNFPFEAIQDISLEATVGFSIGLVLVALASAAFFGGFEKLCAPLANAAIVTCGYAWRYMDEHLVARKELLYVSIVCLAAMTLLAPTSPSNSTPNEESKETKEKKGASGKKEEKPKSEQKKQIKKKTSMVPFAVWFAILAFLFKTSEPESHCFARLGNHESILALKLTDTYSFGEVFSLETSATRGALRVLGESKKGKEKTLFETLPGKAFIVAARDGSFDAPNEEEMGLYDFEDHAANFSVRQSIDNIVASKTQLEVSGVLSFTSGESIDYTFTLFANGRDQVDFRVTTSKPVARLYLRQASSPSEEVYGMGIQYTFSNLKGGCVPVFTMEQGIGRGIQPITYLVNFFVKHASGSWQTSYAPAPYFLTSQLRSLYLRTNVFSLFDFSSPDQISIEVNASDISGAFLFGDSPLDIIETYTRNHAGRMRRLPDWTGNGAIVGLQGGTELVKKHVETLKSADVPIAALWLQDWTGKRETDFGRRLQWNWEFSPSFYPGWFDLIRDLAKEKIYVLSYINTYLADTGGRSNESTTLFQEATKLDCLVKDSDGVTNQIQASATPDFTFGTVDITNPRCQEWYIKEVIQKRMISPDTTSFDNVNGVLGFMADFSESVSLGAKFHAGEGSQLHNDFPVLWAETCRKAIEMNDFTKENVVFFTRAAGSKSPGQTTLMWMGDQMTTFDHYDGLRSALQGMLSAGMSGFALGHSDIGGYTMFQRFGGLIRFRRSAELFKRWTEMNVFSDSVFRTHEGVLPDISVQAVDESVRDHFARFAKLHKALFPILKKPLMLEAEKTGAPLARHMFLHYPHDPDARKAKDQFMVGDSILVCPIVKSKLIYRFCYIPEGEWTEVLSDRPQVPGQVTVCKAPIGEPCVYYLPKAAHIAQVIREVLIGDKEKEQPKKQDADEEFQVTEE